MPDKNYNIDTPKTMNEKILAQRMRLYALDRNSYVWTDEECVRLAERYSDGLWDYGNGSGATAF